MQINKILRYSYLALKFNKSFIHGTKAKPSQLLYFKK